MKRAFQHSMFFVTTLFFFHGLGLAAAPTYGPVTLVNCFVGTANGGNTFPGASIPWGMVSVSPHNDLQSPSGYISGRPFLYGFGHLHLSGAETPGLGNVVLMPTTGKIQMDPEARKSAYDSESAFPGYYKTRLTTFGLLAEMTAACHTGFSRYTFPACDGDANILVDAGARLATDSVRARHPTESSVKIVSNQEISGVSESGDFGKPDSGNRQKIYFVARFSKAAEKTGTWKDGKLSAEPQQQGADVGAFVSFSTAAGESIEVKVGVSYVSVENAELNLETEIPDWDFEAAMRQALAAWDGELSKIKITGGDPAAQKIFYTALYHCLLQPCVFSDVNGQYQGFQHSGVKTAQDYTRYSFFDLADTQRSLHPLLSLVYPKVELDMVKSLVEMGKEGSALPRFEFAGEESGVGVGFPAAAVIADSYLKGLTAFDAPAATEEMDKGLRGDSSGPYGGIRFFLKQGFVPQDGAGNDKSPGTVSASLDYSKAYFALSQWVKAMGQDEQAKVLLSRIGAYRNLYDPKTRFLRPRNQDGTYLEPFDPQAACCDQTWPGSGGPGFYEGTAWQYLFDVPQDLDGLKLLLGGDVGFTKRLETGLTQGDYDPGNPADMADPYLFDEVPGSEWRAQKYVRHSLDQNYGPNADGLPGHDESGTLSAWYVFSAMGFYPLGSASGLYQVGSPLFQRVEVEIDKSFYAGDNLVVKTLNNSPKNAYIQSMDLNGIPEKSYHLTHDTLTRGGVLLLKMGPDPLVVSPPR